jgi:hypothetical protein
MQAVVIAVITTVVGTVVAFWAARHYYTRSVKHRLAVYWLPAPGILFGIDSDTRKELSIHFRGEAVSELAITEFLVANEGVTPIRENIEPLTFAVKNKSRIVDAAVTYIQPEGRKVVVEPTSDKEFRCDFPLLNPAEYFYVKLITDGRVSKSDITCQIVAENLPPKIHIEGSTRVSIGTDERRPDWALCVLALVLLVIGSGIFLPIVALYQAHHSYFPFSGSKFHFSWWLSPSLVLASLASLMFLVVGLMAFLSAWFGEIPPNKKFKGPRRPYHSHFYGYGYPFSPVMEQESALNRYPREEGR